jgi:hypothetical protein
LNRALAWISSSSSSTASVLCVASISTQNSILFVNSAMHCTHQQCAPLWHRSPAFLWQLNRVAAWVSSCRPQHLSTLCVLCWLASCCTRCHLVFLCTNSLLSLLCARPARSQCMVLSMISAARTEYC